MSDGLESEKLEPVMDQTFGPTDTVTFDGKSFHSCFFDRCTIAYHGGHFAHVNCAFSGCTVDLDGPAWRTIQLVMSLGYRITSSAGENPKTKFIQ